MWPAALALRRGGTVDGKIPPTFAIQKPVETL